MPFSSLVTRLSALGYQHRFSGDGFLVFLREEPLLLRVFVIGRGEEPVERWRQFIGEQVLPYRKEGFPFSVGILLTGEAKAFSYLSELPWVEAIWAGTDTGVKMLKPHPRWGVEDRLLSLVFSPPRAAEPAQEEVEFYPPAFLTYLILLLNLFFFAVSFWLDKTGSQEVLLRMGAKYNPRIWMGEYWRLLTPLFLHAGFAHFLINSFALYQLGRVVERLFGKVRFVFLYFLSGLLGSALGTIFRPEIISVGASGALFGLLGALIYFSLRKPATARRFFGSSLWVVLGINLLLGFIIPGIDYLGHLGGFLGGLAGGAAVGLGKKDELPSRWLWRGVALGLTLLLLILALTPPKIDWYRPLEEGRLALSRGDLEEAVSALEVSYARKPDHPLTKEYLLWSYFRRGNQNYEKGDLAAAEADYRRGIALDDSWPSFHYNLGVVYYRQQRIPEAKREFEKVLELDPNNRAAKEILERLP
ncbi:MAG: rhomboid family intramembrane serine protease [Firmicutes bacterium]|nr:rhomboid family intramembrane serine protease [Bacillota bacterium]